MTNKIDIKPSDKILNLPKYIFAELDEWKAEARAKGMELIDLGIGNPDGPTPNEVVEAALESIQNPISHGYPSFRGKQEFRESISKWMKSRYNVDICPEFGIQTLNGAKEGLANIALAFTNPGDINIVPDPYYPVLSRGTWIASGEVYHTPLIAENNFLPDLKAIPEDVAQRAKLFFINYPNNPTAAVAPLSFLKEIVAFCRKYSILLVSDLAYGEICYDGYRPHSIFEVEGAEDIAVEFHSFSKTFNMAGWRVGFVVGKKEFIDTIYAMKTNMDYGTATIVQDAAIKALNMDYKNVEEIVSNYARRREMVVDLLKELGWEIQKTSATMYLWLKVPEGYTSKEFCKYVLDSTGVVLTPGIAFGSCSDGYFRLSLVQPDEKINEALTRLKDANIGYNLLTKC
ncbi:LL-diaminopimelate aminotransferase [bacterium]|nr:LL-diaminopimelate aminotransferase [bacterium]